jgi:hypothetical protein
LPLIEYLLDPSPHGAIAYGLDAATALADPRLLPTLHALEQRLGDRSDLRQAILATTEGRKTEAGLTASTPRQPTRPYAHEI